VLNSERKWLAAVPWETVVTVNRDLCQKDEQPHAENPPGYEKARRVWEDAAGRSMKLREVLDVYRQIHKLAPFKFFNGNTVAAVAKVMMAEVLQPLPSVQAQIARSTVSHYVVGAIKARELEEVLGHVTQLLRSASQAAPAAPVAVPASAASEAV
jgi:hypothetical protein